MKLLPWLILPCILAACASASPGPAIDPSPTPPVAPTPPGFLQTKMYQLTAEMLTRSAAAPKNDATLTAILAGKHALGTSVVETMTAMPTLTLTPTIPPDSPPCQSGSLKASFDGTMGATQSLLLGVGVTNVGASACFLHLRPRAVLVDPSGRVLDIQYTFSPNGDTPADPEATLGLPVGRKASFSMQWGNWCLPDVKGGISIRLTLGTDGGTLSVPTGLSGGPVCNDPGYSSWIGYGPFGFPPEP